MEHTNETQLVGVGLAKRQRRHGGHGKLGRYVWQGSLPRRTLAACGSLETALLPWLWPLWG